MVFKLIAFAAPILFTPLRERHITSGQARHCCEAVGQPFSLQGKQCELHSIPARFRDPKHRRRAALGAAYIHVYPMALFQRFDPPEVRIDSHLSPTS
jgi:hypothetical protein